MCFRYNIDYDDDDASIGDDYFIEVDAGPGSAPKARGLKVRVEDLDADPADPHPFDGYASYNGVSPGCTPVLDLAVDHQILITTWSEALVGGNVITVRESQFHSVTFRDEHAFQETVNQGWPNPYVLHANHVKERHWRILAAAAFAQYRERGGLSGRTYFIYDEACPFAGGSCSLDGSVWLDPAGSEPYNRHKYGIVHELGHAMLYQTGAGQWFVDFLAPTGVCDAGRADDEGWREHSKEYQSAAASEGYANFYAALVFNDILDSDCRMEEIYSPNWDNDPATPADRAFNCTGDPDPMDQPTSATDYLGTMCDAPTLAMGTALDWQRFLWDASKGPDSLAFVDLVDIWVGSTPSTWCPNGWPVFPPPPPFLPPSPPPPPPWAPCWPSDRMIFYAHPLNGGPLTVDEYYAFTDAMELHGVHTGWIPM